MLKRRDVSNSTALVVQVARAVERLAGWTCEARVETFPAPLDCLGYERRADALLVPGGTGFQAGAINEVIKHSRCEALVITCEQNSARSARAHLVQWGRAGACWLGPLRFWASPAAQLWLVGDASLGSDEITIPLGRQRLLPTVAPWRDALDAQEGLVRAERLMAREVEVRS